MPAKRIKYKYQIPFFPNSKKADPNPDDIEEPEHFKYGIYFNDGYDYMSHLVSLEDFNDETVDLNEKAKQDKEQCSMFPSERIKTATVIKEFEADDDCNGETILEKIQNIAKSDIDEDILNALNDDAVLSELEDDFVDIADGVNEKPVIKGDKDIFNQFFGNKIDNEVEDSNGFCDFVSNIRKPIDDISEQINIFEKGNNNLQMEFKMSNNTDNSSKQSNVISKSFLNALDRMKQHEENKDIVLEPIDKSSVFYQGLDMGESEYNEKEIDKAVDEWAYREPKITTSALDNNDKVSKYQPKIVTIESTKKKRKADQMDVVENSDDCDESISEENQSQYTDVSQFHVPRPLNETAEEKRERKKAIKSAKRVRKQEKKLSREMFK